MCELLTGPRDIPRAGLLQWGHVSMLRARKFLDAAVLKGDTIDSVLEQARSYCRRLCVSKPVLWLERDRHVVS